MTSSNKKGQSTGFAWVYGLVTLFGLGILFIVFNQVFTAHLIPTMYNITEETTIDEATKTEIYAATDQYMVFFRTLPYVIFLVVVIYMIVAAVRKERESEFL